MRTAFAAFALLLACCTTTPAARPAGERRLVVLHASDLEVELVADPAADHGGIERFVRVLRALRAQAAAPTIAVAAGDVFMPAPALAVEVDGARAIDRALALAAFDASALGNHEFDRGPAFLAERIRASGMPWLSATLRFGEGPLGGLAAGRTGAPPALEAHRGRILPSGRLCAGVRGPEGCAGLEVGVIGATTELLGTIANADLDATPAPGFDALLAMVQAEADALAAAGVDVVVLLSHLQDVRQEIRLVEAGLRGVDVIVSGGGDDRLADPAHRLLPGDAPHPICAEEPRCYPILRRAVDGDPVAIVATDGQLRYVGRLALAFDERGAIASVEDASRPWPVDDRSIAALDAPPAPEAAALEARVRAALARDAAPIAPLEVALDGSREAVRNRETNLGNLSADAIAWAARRRFPDAGVAFAVRNAGGIRASIEGAITPLAIREALRFDDEVVVVRTTRRVLVETLESALRGAGAGRGQFPQVSAEVELVYDPAGADQEHRLVEGRVEGVARPGAKLRRLVVDGAVLVEAGAIRDPERPIAFATLGFLAAGGDGYFPGATGRIEVLPAGISEQAALAAFVRAQAEAGRWAGGAAWAAPEGRIVAADQ